MNMDSNEKACVAFLEKSLGLEYETIVDLKAVAHLTHTDITFLISDYIEDGMKRDIDNNGIAKRREDLRQKRDEYLKQKESDGSK
jgi:hypothetical protein